MNKYPTIYKDKFGEEISEFITDGSKLSIQLRGILFKGNCFETLEGKIDREKFEYDASQVQNGVADLTNCQFQMEIPIKSRENDIEKISKLLAKIKIGQGEEYGIELTFQLNEHTIANSTKFGFFEDALIDIQKQLPQSIEIKTCLSCKLSHYYPGGNGMFGGLHCFKQVKERTHEIKDKTTLFQVWDLAQNQGKIVNVQETFNCHEHEFISGNDWVYKSWE